MPKFLSSLRVFTVLLTLSVLSFDYFPPLFSDIDFGWLIGCLKGGILVPLECVTSNPVGVALPLKDSGGV